MRRAESKRSCHWILYLTMARSSYTLALAPLSYQPAGLLLATRYELMVFL